MLDRTFLDSLLTAPGTSSFEGRPAAVYAEQARSYGAEVSTDSYGNVFATFGRGGSPRVMLAGHLDEIGMIITYVDQDGLLYFRGVGGWDAQQLVGQRVLVVGHGGDRPGVIGRKPIHLMTAEDRRKVARIDQMWIDIGAANRDEAIAYVRAGDFAVLDQPVVELLGRRLVSKALDNRIGAFIVLEAARAAAAAGAGSEITAVATVQEEISGVGANVATNALSPDIGIAVDVTHATDVPGVNKQQEGDTPLGSGPQFSVGSYVHRGVLQALIDTAEAEEIPYTLGTTPRRTATDADEMAISGRGVPTAVVAVPNRYMHSANELVDLGDVEKVIALLERFLRRLEPGQSFQQPL